MAGCSPIIDQNKRADTVRPQLKVEEPYLNPLRDEAGEAGAEMVHPSTEEKSEWEATKQHIEDLEIRMTEQFEDNNGQGQVRGPILKAPAKPTQAEWDQHQTTHTFRSLVPTLCGSQECSTKPS